MAPPSPVGAVATVGPSNPSAPVACDKHRGTKGWTISEACEACIALAYLHSNNYGEANHFPPLKRKELGGNNPSSSGASGSACYARQGSPDSAQVGPPPPPPFWRALGTERGGVGGPSLSLARLALTWPCKPTLLRGCNLGIGFPIPLAWLVKSALFGKPGHGDMLNFSFPNALDTSVTSPGGGPAMPWTTSLDPR